MPKDTLEKALHEDNFKKPLKYQPDHIDVDIRIHDIDNVDVTCVYHYKDKFPTEDKPSIIELDFEDLKLTPDGMLRLNMILPYLIKDETDA